MLGNAAYFLPAVFNKIFQEHTTKDTKNNLDHNHFSIICAVSIMQKQTRGWGYSYFSYYGGLDPVSTVYAPTQ